MQFKQKFHTSTHLMFSDIFYIILFPLKLNCYCPLNWFHNPLISSKPQFGKYQHHCIHKIPWEQERKTSKSSGGSKRVSQRTSYPLGNRGCPQYWKQSLVYFLWCTEKQIPNRICNETECEWVMELIKGEFRNSSKEYMPCLLNIC